MSNATRLVSLRAATLGYDGVRCCIASTWISAPGISLPWPAPMAPARRRFFGRFWASSRPSPDCWCATVRLTNSAMCRRVRRLDSTFPITAREVVAMGGFGRLKPYAGVAGAGKTAIARCARTGRVSPSGGPILLFSVRRAAPTHVDRPGAHGRPEDIDSRRTLVRGRPGVAKGDQRSFAQAQS